MGRILDVIAPPRMGVPFRWNLASSWVAQLGDGIALAAGPLLVASLTRDPTLIAAAAMVQNLPTLLLGCAMLSLANLVYAHLAAVHPSLAWLATAVSADNVANGIAGTAFIAYMSSLTSSGYTATQYALFGTLWSLPAKSLASQWGRIVDAWGYPPFFVYTALIGLPSLALVLWLIRRDARSRKEVAAA